MSVLSAMLLTMPVLAAGQVDPAAHDFSAVQSATAAKKLAAEGKLIAILLFPAELGGRRHAENVAYITPQAVDDRAAAIQTLSRMVRDGTVDQMTVTPDYRGDSVVPARIHMKAWRNGEQDSFEQVIEIW